jgi:hypothetical protein
LCAESQQTVPKSKRKINTIDTHIHDHSLSWLDKDTSIVSGGVKLVLLPQTFPLSEIIIKKVTNVPKT